MGDSEMTHVGCRGLASPERAQSPPASPGPLAASLPTCLPPRPEVGFLHGRPRLSCHTCHGDDVPSPRQTLPYGRTAPSPGPVPPCGPPRASCGMKAVHTVGISLQHGDRHLLMNMKTCECGVSSPVA